jgi:hypothetical protein
LTARGGGWRRVGRAAGIEDRAREPEDGDRRGPATEIGEEHAAREQIVRHLGGFYGRFPESGSDGPGHVSRPTVHPCPCLARIGSAIVGVDRTTTAWNRPEVAEPA